MSLFLAILTKFVTVGGDFIKHFKRRILSFLQQLNEVNPYSQSHKHTYLNKLKHSVIFVPGTVECLVSTRQGTRVK